LKVLSADFVTSAARVSDIPRDGLPRIAFAGRSNVGKSSLINALCRRKIAQTSAAPGKTRLANVYRVALEGVPRLRSGQGGTTTCTLYLVDLPGYGYARGGAAGTEELRLVAEAYVTAQKSSNVLLLIDSRHPSLESDIQAAEWLDSLGVSRHIVATKIDKLSRAERARNLSALGDTFGSAVLPVSAQSGEGMSELWQLIITLAKSR
jgi:GTP-binding protein